MSHSCLYVTFDDSDEPESAVEEFTSGYSNQPLEKPDKNICITFSNPQSTYHPGASIAGTAHLHLIKPIKARSLKTKINGRASTNWTKPRSKIVRDANGEMQMKHSTVDYYAKITHVDDKILVWKARPTNELMPAGSYDFPFSFQLPPNCPPSFESTLGYIRYTIKMELDRLEQLKDVSEKIFTVVPEIDLNAVPEANIPIEGKTVKNLGHTIQKWKGDHGGMYSLAKTGFVPGEVIVVKLRVSNDSTKPVIKAKAMLIEQTRYLAYDSEKTVESGLFIEKYRDHKSIATSIATVEQELFIAENSKGNTQLHLQVPPTVPSFNTCPIITVEYLLEIKLETNGMLNSGVEASCTVVIGTISVQLRDGPAQPSAPPMDSPTTSVVEPSAPPLESQTSVIEAKGSSLYPVLPPSYEESVSGIYGTAMNADDVESFVPRPFYPSLSEDSKKGAGS